MTTTTTKVTPKHAQERRRVRVSIPKRPAFIATLVYYPGEHRRRRKGDPAKAPSSARSAVVLVPGGSYVRVPLDAVELAGDAEA
jgi:hypothetical protein